MKKTNALRILDNHNISYELVEYTYDPHNLNINVIAENCDLPVEQVFKTLVVKGNKTGILIAVVSGNSSLNIKHLASKSGNKKMTMVPVKEIQNVTGYIRGGCSPIGMKKNFPVFIDKNAFQFEKIYVNAGVRGLLFSITPKDLEKVTQGFFTQIT